MDPVTRAAAALLAGVLIAPVLPGTTLAWACLALGLGALASPWGGLRGVRGVLAAAVVGVLVVRSQPDGPRWEGPVVVLGVRQGASAGRQGDVRVVRWATPSGPWQPGSGRVRVRFPQHPPGPGATVLLAGTAGPVAPALPGAPDPVRAAELARIHTAVVAHTFEVVDPRPPGGPPHDETGLLRAVALGDRSRVSREDTMILRRTGTAHLLAISGFHVGVVAAAVTGAALITLRSLAVVRPRGLPSSGPASLGVAAAWAYAEGAGAPLSAQRAAGLLLLVAGGRAAGRRTSAVPLLALVAVGITLVDPGALATPSLQLSFGAVLGLVLIGPRLARYVPPDLPRPLGWVLQSFVATTSSTLGTLPAAAWWFQEVAPLSPLANLVALPLMGFGIVPAAAVACWGPAPLDGWADVVGTGLARGMLWVLEPMAVTPWTPAVGPAGAVGLVVALVLALVRPWLGAGVAALILTWPRQAPEDLRFTFLDVGQGDATLVEHADGTRWLVDGGPYYGAVLQWLRRSGVRRLDVVVATHAERDHVGGLLAVVQELDVGELWAHEIPDELREAAGARGVPVVAPRDALWPPDATWTGNEGSIVLGVGPVLLAGDIEARAEAELSLPHAFPVLKVPHHGSATSTTPALLDAASPRLAIVSAGRDNRYGHPHDAVLERLRERDVQVLRTDRDGTVVVEVVGDQVRVLR